MTALDWIIGSLITLLAFASIAFFTWLQCQNKEDLKAKYYVHIKDWTWYKPHAPAKPKLYVLGYT